MGPRGRKMLLAALMVAALLSLVTYAFVASVQEQLWNQSIETIKESTRQGRDALKIQLQADFQSLGTISRYLRSVPSDEEEIITQSLRAYGETGGNASLYMADGTCLPAEPGPDEAAREMLLKAGRQSGILNPHISSVTGVNVFQIFQRVRLGDGKGGFLLREYEVKDVADTFSLSFYDAAGFSYIVDQHGEVLMRSAHPNSNKTVQNLFDMLPARENDGQLLSQFRESLAAGETGWAVFTYNGEPTVFCYAPIGLNSDWYVISIIPRDVVLAQTRNILLRTLLLMLCVIAGIGLLAGIYLYSSNLSQRKIASRTSYIGHLYNSIPEGIALLTPEAPYRFLQLNAEGLRLLGYPPEAANDAVRGRALSEVLHPDDVRMTEDAFADAAKRARKAAFTNRMLRPDGSCFWSAVIVESVRDEDGNPAMIATFHDVTKEKLAEEEEKRGRLLERRFLISAISSAYPLIMSVNLTCDTVSVLYDDGSLSLHLPEDKRYSQVYEELLSRLHADYREEFCGRFAPETLKAALGGGRSEVFLEARALLGDGQYHWILQQAVHVEDPFTEERLAILLLRDIEERKRDEEQNRRLLQSALDSANAANAAKSEFLSNMSHDIRTPMNAIVGMTSIAKEHIGEPERLLDCLRKIELSSSHLLRLINDVLDMSKIESGKLALRSEPFDIAELFCECMELMYPQAREAGVDLRASMHGLLDEGLEGDPLRVRQVYLNVLSNAVKYTPKGGSVRVEVTQLPAQKAGYGSYRFSCRDTGLGMDEELLRRLFLPFERGQDQASRKIMGTGLGMAITKNIVDGMAGSIDVKSAPGAGSVFTVTLDFPLQQEREKALPEAWHLARALAVSGEKEELADVVQVLSSLGMRPDSAGSAGEAEAMALRAQRAGDGYQLALVDRRLPDAEGAARRVREASGADAPQVIFFSEDVDAGEGTQGLIPFVPAPLYRGRLCRVLRALKAGDDPAQAAEDGNAKLLDKRILLVEDNELNREIALEMIGVLGVSIDCAHDGVEAVERVASSPVGTYDLILMDIQMPRMDGYEAVRRIRALDRPDAADIPIIAMTANAFAEDVQAALRAGMNGHMSKPIDPDALSGMLRKWLS